ncbi:MAG: hypothetical protein V4652_15000 [Bacteroidota bacterium]
MNEKYLEYIDNIRKNNINEDYLKEKLHLEKLAKQKRTKKIFLNISSTIILLFGVLTAFTFFSKENIFSNKLDFSTLSILGISTIALTATLLMKYLQTDNEDNNSEKYLKDIYLDELSELKYSIELLKNKAGKNQDTEKNISNIIDDYIKNKFTDSFIQNRIDSNYKEEAIKNNKVNNLINYIENKTNRLDDEILRLRKSANLNLVIGSLSTFIAIFCLLYEVFYNEIDFSNNVQILSHYIPRISLVLFIEIFAFFFLKLYKSNLFEIKYFNNEKTNIEFKIFSLKTAILYEDKEMINACISNFINIERNFILKKDESTIDLEKHKYDNINNTDLKDLILGILKTNK